MRNQNLINLSRQERIKLIEQQRWTDIVLVLVELSEEVNVSNILRSAEAFGLKTVYIIPTKKSLQLNKHVTKGAHQWLEIIVKKQTISLLKNLKRQGFWLIASVVNPNQKPIWRGNFSGKIAILIGNETHGLDSKIIKITDEQLFIPQKGLTESFNVANAAAIFLYEAVRQKSKA